MVTSRALLDGSEPFHRAGTPAGVTILDFWRWADSDLLSTALRGRLAEFLVARALDLPFEPRREWLAYDLTTRDGIKVEVKSSAYVQGWFQEKPSAIKFGIAPTLPWDPETGEYDSARGRHADVYVFALLGTEENVDVDPLDVDQWSFLVLPSPVLDERAPTQKTISLSALRVLNPIETDFAGLEAAVRMAMSSCG